jgi:atypical dual specificity phosphatase
MNPVAWILVTVWRLIAYVFRSIFKSVKHFLRHQLHPEVKYVLTIIAFWPSALFNRLYCFLYPSRRRIYDRITSSVILGSVPLFRHDIDRLVREEKVSKFINLCREYNENLAVYREKKVDQLHLPVIDFSVPSAEQIDKGVQFLHKFRNTSVYVHCKAGRGRSTTIVLAYLLSLFDISPIEADAMIRKHRHHVSNKTEAPEVKEWILKYRANYFNRKISDSPSRTARSPAKRQTKAPARSASHTQRRRSLKPSL